MANHVFVSYARDDADRAGSIVRGLERAGIACWFAPRDIGPGGSWVDEIRRGMQEASAVLVMVSPATVLSQSVAAEVTFAAEREVPILPVIVQPVAWDRLPARLAPVASTCAVDLSDVRAVDSGVGRLVGALVRLAPGIRRSGPADAEGLKPQPSKGYVFISYSRHDSAFVEQLKGILKRRGYAYWDYSESERDYHGALYRELEEKIEGAAAFMCVVTDAWRESEWPASEYIYAREAKVPVFVIQAGVLSRPVPIILNKQTRIDMATDFAKGSITLEKALDKEGL